MTAQRGRSARETAVLFNRRTLGAVLFFVIAGYGLAARDTITDARWIALLWLSWIPLLVAVWPDVPPTVPPLGRSVLRMTMIFLSILTLFAVQLLRVQVVMSDSITHRIGIDPVTGDVISNPLLTNEALTIPRGAIYDRDGVTLARTVFENDVARRVYPEPATGEVTGYFSPLLYGSSGLEASWDDELAGRTGGNPLARAVDELRGLPRRGLDLRLTLDAGLQRQAHAALGERTGAAVLLDIETGAVLALTSTPSFDPNALVVVTADDREPAQAAFAALTSDPRAPLVQRATSGLYPPGSTFKTITAAAAIDTGVAQPDTIYEDAGALMIAGHTLVEQNRPNEQQTLWSLTESLAWSLNVVFAQIGLQLGGDTLAQAARGWGWDSDIPFDLPVEPSRVSVTPGFLDNPVAVAETAFGQGELLTTPLQMAITAAGIGNDGEIMRPHLVASIAEPDGETVRETRTSRWRRGTGPEAARQTAGMMIFAVENGALGTAFTPGYTIGGKTGTAETGSGDPHAWFIGFIGLPGEEPRYAVAVIVEAGGGGGQVALPIGRDLLIAAMAG
ncbi:MAG: penicillin-binding protein 2 [Chloroflexi bacterium]|nr:penicillin-binding protein 2 [Chloroflexota bacterium]